MDVVVRVRRDLATCAAGDGVVEQGRALYDGVGGRLVHERPRCKIVT